MRVKLYTAPGMPQAIARIRAELGDDAVILGSRRVTGGIEVTAALEDGATSPPSAGPAETPAPRNCLLLEHGTPAPLAAKLRAGPLPFALSVVLRFEPLDEAAFAGNLLFIGPPGAGKTLTIARLATRRVLAGHRPGVLTADSRRAAAFEQLAAYTDLLGLPLHGFADRRTDAPPTLIDTPGLDPFDRHDRAELAALIAHADAMPVLVLPAGLDPAEATELAEAFAANGARRLVATRLDIARRLGAILAAAAILPLAELGIGPDAPAGLVPATAPSLAARLQRRPTDRRPV